MAIRDDIKSMNQESGIKSLDEAKMMMPESSEDLKQKAPSIKLASETPAEEFELEINMMLKEFQDAIKEGYKGTLEEFSDYYFSQKEMMKDRKMAMYGGRMQYGDGAKEYGLYDDVIPKRYPDPVTARLETDKEEAAMKREQASIADKKGKPKSKPFSVDVEKLKKLIDQRKKEQEKLAKGGIAGVL